MEGEPQPVEKVRKFSIPRLGLEGELPESYQEPVLYTSQEIQTNDTEKQVRFNVPRLGIREIEPDVSPEKKE